MHPVAKELPVLLAAVCLLAGCGSLVQSATSGLASNLSDAILDQEDPALVRDGTPAYLLLLDSFVAGSPDNADLLGAASQLYAAYGAAFVTDERRAQLLTSKGLEYGRRALCAEERDACRLDDLDFAAYQAAIESTDERAADALFTYAVATLAYIRAHSSDFTALADLPKAEVALVHLLSFPDGGNPVRRGDVYKYLGILNTLRPPALGGKPERGREYFERALDLSEGRDLSVKVEYARGYARLVYERELHDRLLSEVLAADPRSPGLTLFNSLAQEQARELLASADDYF
jgi:hypothetical protein